MAQIGKAAAFSFRVEQFECNVRRQLRFSHLLNMMLAAADSHSNERGFGTDYLNTIDKTWVLSRFAVQMSKIPQRHQTITIETWVEGVTTLSTSRNFRILLTDANPYEEGYSGRVEVIGYGRSIWAMMDMVTRKAVDLFSVKCGPKSIPIPIEFNNIEDFVVKEEFTEFGGPTFVPIQKPSRIAVKECAFVREVPIYFSDIDFNGHINSIKYIDHLLDTYPLSWHKEHCIKRIDMAYILEGRCEIPIRINRLITKEPNSEEAPYELRNCYTDAYKITQMIPDDRETCRIRIIWEKMQ